MQTALNLAGPNKPELLTVISDYSQNNKDSLKLKAAYFLIENMPHLHYYEGELLDKYMNYPKFLSRDMFYVHIGSHYFDRVLGHFSVDQLNLHYDIKEVSAHQLESNIDMAFKAWQEQPWGLNYNFNQFCEYILPWRLADEAPEYNNRNEIYRDFNDILDSIRLKNGSAIDACTAINNELKRKGWFLFIGLEFLPHTPISKLLEYQTGSCREQSDFGAYIMRSVGIPVSIDFVPQWPTRSGNHTFNAVINKNGKPILFNAADDNPAMSSHIDMKKGKVYRHIYHENMQSLAVLKDAQEIIPSLFSDAYIQDVTDEYCDCSEAHISIKGSNLLKGKIKYAYLCVFDDVNWVPIDWSNINSDSIIFHKLENDIVYMPAAYIDATVIPLTDPFILRKGNKIEFIRPDSAHLTQSVTIKHIFPVTPDRTAKLRGDFEGSDNPSFTDAKVLFSFSPNCKINPFWNNIIVKNSESFRYVRYFSHGECTIGEMEFYSGGEKLSGKLIGDDLLNNNGLFSKEKAIDGDISTSYFSKKDNAWVGLDLGRFEHLDSIRYSPGVARYAPAYHVISDHRYELNYWYHGNWMTFGDATATGDSVIFNNFPSNDLYLLHDLSTQQEERIFTIRDGTQIWW